MTDPILAATRAIAEADALLIAAGAGMGVDSGLPDFRGTEGFWEAYPPFAELGYSFQELADPRWFRDDPELAWGFYGHRLTLYRNTTPHKGFALLKQWAEAKSKGYFVFTSNVDGQFQRAGFVESDIVECHGSIHYLQCSEPCHEELWPVDDVVINIDESTMRADPPLPECPHCGAVARPNILLFNDGQWLWRRSEQQRERLQRWLSGLSEASLTIVECGAGETIPTVRRFSEELVYYGATLVRINPREAEGPAGTISVPLPALEALMRMQEVIASS